jgi:hypothetical protein
MARMRAGRSLRPFARGALKKKKGRAGRAVQPKSREETPKVGTPWGLGPATALTVIWACSCCAATSPHVFPTVFGKSVSGWQHRFAKWQRLSFAER